MWLLTSFADGTKPARKKEKKSYERTNKYKGEKKEKCFKQ